MEKLEVILLCKMHPQGHRSHEHTTLLPIKMLKVNGAFGLMTTSPAFFSLKQPQITPQK